MEPIISLKKLVRFDFHFFTLESTHIYSWDSLKPEFVSILNFISNFLRTTNDGISNYRCYDLLFSTCDSLNLLMIKIELVDKLPRSEALKPKQSVFQKSSKVRF